jgi:hypothetical protein
MCKNSVNFATVGILKRRGERTKKGCKKDFSLQNPAGNAVTHLYDMMSRGCKLESDSIDSGRWRRPATFLPPLPPLPPPPPKFRGTSYSGSSFSWIGLAASSSATTIRKESIRRSSSAGVSSSVPPPPPVIRPAASRSSCRSWKAVDLAGTGGHVSSSSSSSVD